MDLKQKLRQLTCQHQWVKVAVFEEHDKDKNIMYPIRRYECMACGRISHQDGRHDRLASKAMNR